MICILDTLVVHGDGGEEGGAALGTLLMPKYPVEKHRAHLTRV